MDGLERNFDDIVGESELDSAKMVLRLTAELRDKDLELVGMRSRSFEEIQKNNKAKEEEFEALIRAQDERIKKREQELGRMLVEKESGLWQKYQHMLDEAIARQRGEFEQLRAQQASELKKKESDLAARKKELRAEMEELFKTWETEREADFKRERDAFAEKLKIARETARKEGAERLRQSEEIWSEKLAQQETDFKNREALTAEAIRSQMRRERVEELKALTDTLNAESARREQDQYARYAAWLEENKKTFEEKASRRVEIIETEFRDRATRLEDTAAKARADLAAREAAWAGKYEELKTLYAGKEKALENAAAEMQARHLAAEKEFIARSEAAAGEARAEALRQKELLQKKEKALEDQAAARQAELDSETERREKAMDERDARAAAEKAELSALRARISDILAEKERELESAFEERQSLLRQSLEESIKIKETSLAKKQEDLERQHAALGEQKDAALARINALTAENSRLKDAMVSKDSQARTLVESERAGFEAERKRLEEEYNEKNETLKAGLALREQALRNDLDEKLKTGQDRLSAQFKIREAALEEERKALNRHAAELEAGFLEALKKREGEITENFRRNSELMRAQAEAARQAWKEEKAAMAAQAEADAQHISAVQLEAAARRESELRTFYENREKEAAARAAQAQAEAQRRAEETFAIRERDLRNLLKDMEDKLAHATDGSSTAQNEINALKEELERLTRTLEESAGEKQKLIQENLNKARDLRQTLEKEFLDKLKDVEQKYLAQLSDLARLSDENAKKERGEYFAKMQFMNDEFNARLGAQAKDLEAAYMERERKLASSMEDSFKLKAQALAARQEQLENSYQTMLSDKSAQIDTDRTLADSVTKMKSDMEAKNRQLNETIASYNTRLEEAEDKLRAELDVRRKNLEGNYRMRTSQMDAERAKLKALLDQEQQLVSDLQKRETALQESYGDKETELARRFKESRERMEKEYQERLQEMKKKAD